MQSLVDERFMRKAREIASREQFQRDPVATDRQLAMGARLSCIIDLHAHTGRHQVGNLLRKRSQRLRAVLRDEVQRIGHSRCPAFTQHRLDFMAEAGRQVRRRRLLSNRGLRVCSESSSGRNEESAAGRVGEAIRQPAKFKV